MAQRKLVYPFRLIPAIALFLVAIMPAHASQLTEQDKLKAAYLFNFTRFIEWRDKEFETSKRAVNICLGDRRAFKDFLENVVRGRRVGNSEKPINILNFSRGDDNSNCHISYITSEEDAEIVQENSMLKVGATEELASYGTALNFYENLGKVRFEVYTARLAEQGVNISDRLLRLGRIRDE